MNKTENEIIAEFMGETDDAIGPGGPYQYDKFWDVLMPVVQKIRKIVERNHSKSVGPENEDMELFDKIVDNGLAWVDIDSTYKAVVEFIKWHNIQNNDREENR